MKNTKLLLTLAVFGLASSLYAQDDDFAKYKERQSRTYNEFKDREKSEYRSFQDSINKEFASHISKTWKEYSVFVGEEPEKEPKPKNIPVAEPNSAPENDVEIEIEEIVEPVEIIEEEVLEEITEDVFEEDVTTESSYDNTSRFSIDLFNPKIALTDVNVFSEIKLSGTDEKSVSALWGKFADNAYAQTAYQIKNIAEDRNINDYGTYLLITKTAQTLFPNKPNEQIVYTVYLLNQLGFKAKIARTGNDLIALISVRQLVYKRSYLNYEKNRFYVFTSKPDEIKDCSSIYTYDDLMKNCSKSIDLNFYKPLSLGDKVRYVTVKTDDASEINVKINLEDINFFNNYPHTEMQVYANAEMNDEINNALLGTLSKQIDGKSDLDAVNYLLDFIYASCEYKTDGEQFGYEKPMFCEETLYYPYSDCEDNSILFSYLVRKLLGFDVVLLDYPGHIATAVKIPGEVNGSYLQLEDGKYIVCDPTYYGASAGMSMPQYQNVKLSVIELNRLKMYE